MASRGGGGGGGDIKVKGQKLGTVISFKYLGAVFHIIAQNQSFLQGLHRPLQLLPNGSYRKNSKIWDTSNNCHNCPKNRNVCCNIALMHPKDADGMANSVDPDQTASSEAV